MHFVTGGAFHGKNRWVRTYYQLNEQENVSFLNGYMPTFDYNLHLPKQGYCVIFGLEQIIKQFCCYEEAGRDLFNKQLEKWLIWEKENDARTLILIGNDIGKGIVPVDKKERLWRDLVGWCYQDIVQKASEVDIVWYGLHEKLKQEVVR